MQGQQSSASWMPKRATGQSILTQTAPRFPQTNWFIERQVQTIKKCKKEKQSLHLAILDLRATPVDSKLPSPADMLMGRPITTLLPSGISPSPVTVAQRQHLDRRQSTMKSNYDRHAGESVPPLHKGQNVRVLDKASKTWIPGEVTGTAESQGPTTSEQTRGPTSDATEET